MSRLVDNLQMERKTPKSDKEKIRDLQRKLYLKAKQEKDFRFYVLYDKIRDIRYLREAYRQVKANKGKPGVDRKSFEEIEQNGIEEFLRDIQQELVMKTYKPSPVLRVYIRKANGKMRPLGIPTIKDRVVQMSCKIVIEPIFEADFENCSYGFRPKRSAKGAMKQVQKQVEEGRYKILDADLSSYFDTIPHEKLLKLVGMRISDTNVLHLIKMWLKSPIVEDGKISGGKENKLGTPQGGVISPLLANIYLHLLDRIVNRKGSIFHSAGIKIVRYADDFILMGKEIPLIVMETLKKFLDRLELSLNEEKTRITDVKVESFDFLGFTTRMTTGRYSKYRKYLSITPSKKAEKSFRQKIDEYLKSSIHKGQEELVKGLNGIIRGWRNYYEEPGLVQSHKSRQKLSYYLGIKLQWYYQRKSQRRSWLSRQKAVRYLIDKHKLINLATAKVKAPANVLR